jgi:hypothetical protein
MTALELIDEAREQGITLRAKDNSKLGFKPKRLCPPEFKDKLRTHKVELLALLQTKGVTWIEVYSRTLEANVFFCEDEETKAALIEAGADEFVIYTKDELRVLIAQNRAKPFLPDELRKAHNLRRAFHGRIAR